MPDAASMPPVVRPRIVLVEDDPDFARYISLLLRTQIGGDVTHYDDGLDGLVGILSEQPKLVVLDLDLPTIRGEEICRRLRSSQRTSELPIIICSSMPEPQKRELQLLHIGADAYLEKPFVDEQFLGTVSHYLSSGRSKQPSFMAAQPGSLESDLHDPPLNPHDTPVTPSPDIPRIGSPDPDGVTTPGVDNPLQQRRNPTRTDADTSPQLEPPSPQVDGSDGSETVGSLTTPASEFAGYQLQGIIGGGGMGTVYKAVRSTASPGNVVALKVLLRSLTGIPMAVERFMRERRIMEGLTHPNIVRVLDGGKTAYSYYIAMEFVDGPNLDARIEAGPLPWEQSVSVASQLFDALEYLHSRGVLHRDLKPSNVLLAPDGRIKLSDFGISRDDAFKHDLKLTRDASLVGTPSFMAPEQLQGAEATPSTDLYSLGRTLLHLFEGRRPVVPPIPLHVVRKDMPRSLSDAISRMTHADSEQRFPTLDEARHTVMAACAERV